jgi:DNA-directed RNA polymerase subunit RPC12/RpoP
MSSNEVKCEYCDKVFSTLSNLNYHKKTAKFCISIQQNKKTEYKCEHCNKEFSEKRYLNQHNLRCKSKKESDNKDNKLLEYFMKENETLKKEFENMKKEINNIKNMLIDKSINSKPTVINNGNTYQIQFNQLFDKIEPFTTPNINKKISSISVLELGKYNMRDLGSSMSKSLSNILKDFTFCVDSKDKQVIIKTQEEEYKKMSIDEFINLGLNLGIKGIQSILNWLEKKYDNKLNIDKTITEEEYIEYDEAIQKIKDFFRKEAVSIHDEDYPFENLSKQTLLNCESIKKTLK